MTLNALAMVVVFSGNAASVKAALVVSARVNASPLARVISPTDIMNSRAVLIDGALVFATTSINGVVGISFKSFETGALGAMVERVADGIGPALAAITRGHAFMTTDTNFT